MTKEILHGKDARDKIIAGVDKLANTVVPTLGPWGRTIILDAKFGPPTITKDGVTVARAIELKDRFEDIGARLLKEVALKTNDLAGDGTTTAIALARCIVKNGIKSIESDVNPLEIRTGIEKGVEIVVKELKKSSVKVSSKEEIAQVASISANDKAIGKQIAETMEEIGRDGIITVEESKTLLGISGEVVDGMEFERGYISPYMITNIEKMESELKDVYVLITDKKISMIQELLPIIQQMTESGKLNLLIVAEDVENEALATLITNNLRGSFKSVAVKAPGFGNATKDYLEDIAVLTGGKVVSTEAGLKLEDVKLGDLGKAMTIRVTKDKTMIVGGAGEKDEIDKRIAQVKLLIKNSEPGLDQDNYNKRLASLSGGVAIIKVGAASEVEMSEKKDRIEDALASTKAAVEEGIVAGGGTAFIRALTALDGAKWTSGEQVGVEILKLALEEPVKQIAKNAGKDGVMIVEGVKTRDGNEGYDALTGKFVDMVKAGIVDPTKVTRTALQNAASVAATFLTTEAVVVDVPVEDYQIPLQPQLM